MAAHVFYGSGAPTSTPTAVGQHYVDTLNGTSYLSVGTTSFSDWKVAGSAGTGSSAIAIGTSIISGTSGSILFIGNGLAQDNANLFYDDANNQFIANAVKTNTTLQFKDALSGGTLAVTVYAPTLAAGYTLRLPINDGGSGEFLQTDGSGVLSWAAASGGSGSSQISIGISIASGTSGSVLFVGNGVAQDNANFFYDDANDRLITANSRVNNSLQFKDALSGGTNLITIYGPSLAAGYTLRLPVDDGTASQFLQTDGNGILSWATAAGGAGSSQISIGMSVASGTSGSILFIGDGLAQDNANLFYDDANNRFIANAARTNSTLQFKDSLSGGTLTIQFAAPSLATGYSLYLPPDGPTFGMVLNSGASTLQWVFDNRGLFGRGASGDIVYSVNTTLAGNAYYNNITVNSGVALSTSNYILCATGSLVNEGTIRNNGGNGGTTAAGTAASTAYYTSGGAGGAGGAGGGLAGATVASSVFQYQGGTGGTGSGGGGGVPGAVPGPALSAGGQGLIQNYVTIQIPTTAGTATKYGFGSGGGGGGGDGTAGGGGGSAAGHVMILAKNIYGSGVIQAIGGNGGTPSGGNRGGGGGGAGGLITVISTTGIPSTMTTDVSAGIGGTGTGTGTNGGVGSTGIVNEFIMQGIT